MAQGQRVDRVLRRNHRRPPRIPPHRNARRNLRIRRALQVRLVLMLFIFQNILTDKVDVVDNYIC